MPPRPITRTRRRPSTVRAREVVRGRAPWGAGRRLGGATRRRDPGARGRGEAPRARTPCGTPGRPRPSRRRRRRHARRRSRGSGPSCRAVTRVRSLGGAGVGVGVTPIPYTTPCHAARASLRGPQPSRRKPSRRSQATWAPGAPAGPRCTIPFNESAASAGQSTRATPRCCDAQRVAAAARSHDPVLAELAVERGPGDPEEGGRLALAALRVREGREHRALLGLVRPSAPRRRRAGPGRRRSRGAAAAGGPTSRGRSVGGQDVARREDERALERVLELAHVARPAVRAQRARGRRRRASATRRPRRAAMRSRNTSASSSTSSPRSRSGGQSSVTTARRYQRSSRKRPSRDHRGQVAVRRRRRGGSPCGSDVAAADAACRCGRRARGGASPGAPARARPPRRGRACRPRPRRCGRRGARRRP